MPIHPCTGVAFLPSLTRTSQNQVFDITCLQIFTPNELDYLLCGRRELWEVLGFLNNVILVIGGCVLELLFLSLFWCVLWNDRLLSLFNHFLFMQSESLADNIKFDHGYTAKSPAIVNVGCFPGFSLD